MSLNCKIIAISGGSGSGKTALSRILAGRFSGMANIINQDNYYKDLSHLSESQRELTNFDHPESIDFDLLHEDIKSIKKGVAISSPMYCFKSHTRLLEKELIKPVPYIIVEGIYSCFNENVRKLFDYSVYVSSSDDIRLIRRIRRDVVERGRSVQSVLSQYENTVRIMHAKYVEKQREYVNCILKNDGEEDLVKLTEKLYENLIENNPTWIY